MLRPLRLGAAVRFSDRWEGKVSAVEVDDGWNLTNLTVRKSFLLFKSSVRLPFSAVYDWSTEGVLFDCSSEEAFAHRIAPLAAPARSLSQESPSLSGIRLSGLLVERAKRRARYLLISHSGPLSRERKAPVDQVTIEAGRLQLGGQVKEFAVYRDDEEIDQLVWAALREDRRISAADRRGITVEVADGQALLEGNVRGAQVTGWAERAASSVEGVASVVNELIDDDRLEIEVAQALARAGHYRKAHLYVRSHLGEVTLSGRASSRGMADDIARTAERVRGVKTVIDRLDIGEQGVG